MARDVPQEAGSNAVAVWVVFFAALGFHLSSVGGGLVYDDHRFIEHNEAIHSVPWGTAFTDPGTASHASGVTHDIYRPLRTLLFSFQYALFAEEVTQRDGRVSIDFHLGWWHLVSVLLHALNAVLVFFLLLPMLRRDAWTAAAGALLFALHPLTSESVAWLSSQGDLLAMSFGLGALLVLARRGVGRTALGAALFALACLAKESALALPALLPLRDLALPRSAGGDDEVLERSPWADATGVRVGVLAVVALLYLTLRLGVISGLAQVDHPGGSVLATARAMAAGLLWYLQAIAWPLGFSFDTRIDVPFRWSDPEVVVGLGVLLTTLGAGIYGLARGRYVLAFATLGFLLLLVPVSNVIVPLKTFVADRFLYPGLVCVGAGVAAGLAHLSSGLRVRALFAFGALLVGLGLLTTQRNESWADEMTLWRAVAAERPENANAWQGIGYEYHRRSMTAEAELGYKAYLEANPEDGKVIKSLGDLMGLNAESLVRIGPAGPGEVSTDVNRKRARAAQIGFYRKALVLWSRPDGLRRHRGSEDLRAEMLERWIEAAVDLGDLRSAKFASDVAIDLEARGRGYTHEDGAKVAAHASWLRRRARLLLALRAVQIDREAPKALREQIVADRRAVLTDVGLDPAQSNKALIHPLREQLDLLLKEALADPELTPDVGLFIHRARLVAAETGRKEEAIRALQEALRVHPESPALLDELRFWQSRAR